MKHPAFFVLRRTACFVAFLGVAQCLFASAAFAQNDQVFVKGSNKAQRGTVAAILRDGVQLKSGANAKAILSGDITKIIFQGDTSELTKGREFTLDGQYEQGLEELEKVDASKLKPNAKAEAAYYTVLCKAKLALAGRGDKAAAAGEVIKFRQGFQNSWHYFDATKVLGDLALAMNNFPNAVKLYKSLDTSKSPIKRIESVYLLGVTKLAQGDSAGAGADFEKIVKMKADTPEKVRLQTLSNAGKAVALAKAGKGDAGLKLVNGLIEKLNPTDVEMSARIYNAQGASYEASGDTEGAILAYLHTHLMFSTQPDAHAEALSRLVELWPKVGKPERAAEARQELTQRYPGYGK